MVLNVIAFVVLCVLVVLGVVVFVKLAQWPKKTATARNHPQVDAINLLSWLGLLLTGGVGWIVALTWAYTKPLAFAEGGAADLQARIAKLEAEVATLRPSAES